MEVIRLSSKGQVVIPKSIREKMNLKNGDKLIAFTSGDLIILRKVREESAFNLMSRSIREKIAGLGVERAEVEKAVSWARRSVEKD